MNNLTIGFIGFGLIGGSIAKAIKEKYPTYHLVAYDYEYSGHTNTNLKIKGIYTAVHDKVLDDVYTDLQALKECDIIFLCAPVLSNINYLEQLKGILKPSCILTDVGSVKESIHKAASVHQLDHQFIGGHPMAGSEKTGYEHSHSRLLENAYYILTPSSHTSEEDLNCLSCLIKEIGAIPIVLDFKEHDDITAAISHIPHIIAASLVNLVKDSDDDEAKMRSLAAGGFKDITRIASASPSMWQNICLTNADSINKFLESYITSLEDIKKAVQIQDKDYLYQLFSSAKEYRSSIPNHMVGALMKKIYELYIDLIDEAGAIATLATLLATNGISLKNIGIIHNREFEEGVLRIEFYDDTSKGNAITLLNRYNYTIYDR